ncbi:DUF4397 domain-containing protein [Arcicella sp. LKC2W]|uniref:DUF4397 domain-containing protein n=1 Tax=Arcicella sp. LKC2W TaxID=2984198 RepID=UPI002B20FADE|nr:DUF4397 domain-containing protein [Arcicella sp. LKC2W]MEA5460662.1 DUF4397 domain-containing protein [Arcicella sp. LKC2W]
MKYISFTALALICIGLFSCEKTLIEANQQWALADPNSANVKVVNAYTSNVPAGATGVGVTRFYIYQDASKLNGTAIASLGTFPVSSTYSSMKTGSTTFNFLLDRRIGNVYGNPIKGDTAFSAKMTLEASKYYTIFMIGESPKQSLWLVEDKISDPKENYYAVRFANVVVSASNKPIDVFSRRQQKKIATNVAYKGITDFTEIPIASISDTLDVMDAGTTKVLYSLNNFNPTSRRIYTFFTYGRTGFAPERLTAYINR